MCHNEDCLGYEYNCRAVEVTSAIAERLRNGREAVERRHLMELDAIRKTYASDMKWKIESLEARHFKELAELVTGKPLD